MDYQIGLGHFWVTYAICDLSERELSLSISKKAGAFKCLLNKLMDCDFAEGKLIAVFQNSLILLLPKLL